MDGDAWNDMSSTYDNCVENNPDPIISDFIKEEIKITTNLCRGIIKPGKKYSIIDLGSGTGRILFSLYKTFGDSVSYCGLDASTPMVEISKQKLSDINTDKIKFLNFDTTETSIDELFDEDSVKIVMCMYNTIGVITPSKRQQFFDNMKRLAGVEGLALISAFNGDNFALAAPKIYRPMKEMVKHIDDDSFDEEKLAFRNHLGYYSQWFTKKQISSLIGSNQEPIPIKVNIENKLQTLGHVFTDRQI